MLFCCIPVQFQTADLGTIDQQLLFQTGAFPHDTVNPLFYHRTPAFSLLLQFLFLFLPDRYLFRKNLSFILGFGQQYLQAIIQCFLFDFSLFFLEPVDICTGFRSQFFPFQSVQIIARAGFIRYFYNISIGAQCLQFKLQFRIPISLDPEPVDIFASFLCDRILYFLLQSCLCGA